MKKKVTSKSWIIGFLGCIGFLGINGEPIMFLWFSFFGGFQYFWYFKLGVEIDERLIENKNRASVKSLQYSLVFGLLANVALGFMSSNFEFLYKVTLIIFSLTFALGMNLWAYLTYKYDLEE
ncbi:DUF3796 domain-containing protein [Carnobacterium maltaromaticum]|uniref:DUF3796 domain-containing protein n=1 Tax=Carnobacterium maltaromaticum TaxID=2751 RepID=UPI00298A541E|nr:DUF3796 domain-containing protein [Carnobacterium maltaromaticum]MDW5522656.1 DUF3796 domain-containing protein [Carnobacterium maltaromaticum]